MIGPAARRASGVWIGTGIVGAIIFGPNGMHPHDFTELALHVPVFGVVVGLTWLLLFVPTARVLVRADGATYLRSLPGPRWQPLALGTLAMIVLQLPWLIVWLLGDGMRGLAVVAALTIVIVVVARWRTRPPRAGWPRWRGGAAALRGIYLRALRRRAGDAIVRGVGLAVLAGLAAGLFVRNNALHGPHAAVLGAGVIAIVLVPGWVGALFPLVEAHRAAAWLAATVGISPSTRVGVLASVVGIVYAVGAAIAGAAAAIAFSFDADTIGSLVATAVLVAIGSSLVTTRGLVWADRGEALADAPKDAVSRGEAAARVVIGAIAAAALAVICLAALGLAGVLGIIVIGSAAVLTARQT